MYSGGFFVITIKDEIKESFYSWAERGNKNHLKSNLALMGLKFRFFPIEGEEHFLIVEHTLFFNFQIWLKLAFILMARRKRKYYSIRNAKKRDFVNYLDLKGWY